MIYPLGDEFNNGELERVLCAKMSHIVSVGYIERQLNTTISETVKQHHFPSAPKTLFIRSQHDNLLLELQGIMNGDALSCKRDIPYQFTKDINGVACTYELVAVRMSNSIHTIAYVRYGQQWWIVDDNRKYSVTACNLSGKALSSQSAKTVGEALISAYHGHDRFEAKVLVYERSMAMPEATDKAVPLSQRGIIAHDVSKNRYKNYMKTLKFVTMLPLFVGVYNLFSQRDSTLQNCISLGCSVMGLLICRSGLQSCQQIFKPLPIPKS